MNIHTDSSFVLLIRKTKSIPFPFCSLSVVRYQFNWIENWKYCATETHKVTDIPMLRLHRAPEKWIVGGKERAMNKMKAREENGMETVISFRWRFTQHPKLIVCRVNVLHFLYLVFVFLFLFFFCAIFLIYFWFYCRIGNDTICTCGNQYAVCVYLYGITPQHTLFLFLYIWPALMATIRDRFSCDFFVLLCFIFLAFFFCDDIAFVVCECEWVSVWLDFEAYGAFMPQLLTIVKVLNKWRIVRKFL